MLALVLTTDAHCCTDTSILYNGFAAVYDHCSENATAIRAGVGQIAMGHAQLTKAWDIVAAPADAGTRLQRASPAIDGFHRAS